jgi:hypothetical protein
VRGPSYWARRVDGLVYKITTFMPAKRCTHCNQKRCRCCSTQDLETDGWGGEFLHSVVKKAGDAATSAADTMLVNSYFKANPDRFQEVLKEAQAWKAKGKTQEFSASQSLFLVDAGLVRV